MSIWCVYYWQGLGRRYGSRLFRVATEALSGKMIFERDINGESKTYKCPGKAILLLPLLHHLILAHLAQYFFLIFIYLFGCAGSYLFIYYYIYFWLCWVFVSVQGLSPVVASGGYSSSRCAGLFTIAASLVAEHRLQTRRLSSCGSRAQFLRGMWDPPRPGLELVSPALAGRFSTTAPPGKPCTIF